MRFCPVFSGFVHMGSFGQDGLNEVLTTRFCPHGQYLPTLVILYELSYSVNEQNVVMNHNLTPLHTDHLRIYNIVIGAVYDYNV